MGYDVDAARKIFALQFSGGFPDLEIKVASISFGELLELGDQIDRIRAGAGLAGARDLIRKFVDSVESWSLERRGEPLPVTVENFLLLGPDAATAALKAWDTSMVSVSVALGKDSTSGPPSAPPNLPMEPLS